MLIINTKSLGIEYHTKVTIDKLLFGMVVNKTGFRPSVFLL